MYAVVFTYSFDGECPVYLFDTYNDAAKFLKSSFLEEVRVDTEENAWNADCELYMDDGYAKITNHFADHDDITEFHIGTVYATKDYA